MEEFSRRLKMHHEGKELGARTCEYGAACTYPNTCRNVHIHQLTLDPGAPAPYYMDSSKGPGKRKREDKGGKGS